MSILIEKYRPTRYILIYSTQLTELNETKISFGGIKGNIEGLDRHIRDHEGFELSGGLVASVFRINIGEDIMDFEGYIGVFNSIPLSL